MCLKFIPWPGRMNQTVINFNSHFLENGAFLIHLSIWLCEGHEASCRIRYTGWWMCKNEKSKDYCKADNNSLLLRRFVFRMAEESAKREWLVMNRKGPWEGYRRQSRPLSPSRLPLRVHFHRKRDVWVRGSDNNVNCFFRTKFRLAIPAFFRFTNVYWIYVRNYNII